MNRIERDVCEVGQREVGGGGGGGGGGAARCGTLWLICGLGAGGGTAGGGRQVGREPRAAQGGGWGGYWDS